MFFLKLFEIFLNQLQYQTEQKMQNFSPISFEISVINCAIKQVGLHKQIN